MMVARPRRAVHRRKGPEVGLVEQPFTDLQFQLVRASGLTSRSWRNLGASAGASAKGKGANDGEWNQPTRRY